MNYETMFLKGGKDQPEPKKTSKEVKEEKKKEKGKKNAQKNFEDENDQYPMSDN